MIYWIVAIPVEAKALIRSFGLKLSPDPYFPIYTSSDMALILTGAGKKAVISGLSYGIAKHPSPSPTFINVGMAGHKKAPLGEGYLIHKIYDPSEEKAYYPALTFSWQHPTQELYTIKGVENSYPHPCLYDQEGAFFFSTALRFTTAEKIHLYKIVSDHTKSPSFCLTKEKIIVYTEKNLPILQQLVFQLKSLFPSCKQEDFLSIFSLIPASTYQRHQILEKCQFLLSLDKGFKIQNLPLSSLKTAAKLLCYLEEKIDTIQAF